MRSPCAGDALDPKLGKILINSLRFGTSLMWARPGRTAAPIWARPRQRRAASALPDSDGAWSGAGRGVWAPMWARPLNTNKPEYE